MLYHADLSIGRRWRCPWNTYDFPSDKVIKPSPTLDSIISNSYILTLNTEYLHERIQQIQEAFSVWCPSCNRIDRPFTLPAKRVYQRTASMEAEINPQRWTTDDGSAQGRFQRAAFVPQLNSLHESDFMDTPELISDTEISSLPSSPEEPEEPTIQKQNCICLAHFTQFRFSLRHRFRPRRGVFKLLFLMNLFQDKHPLEFDDWTTKPLQVTIPDIPEEYFDHEALLGWTDDGNLNCILFINPPEVHEVPQEPMHAPPPVPTSDSFFSTDSFSPLLRALKLSPSNASFLTNPFDDLPSPVPSDDEEEEEDYDIPPSSQPSEVSTYTLTLPPDVLARIHEASTHHLILSTPPNLVPLPDSPTLPNDQPTHSLDQKPDLPELHFRASFNPSTILPRGPTEDPRIALTLHVFTVSPQTPSVETGEDIALAKVWAQLHEHLDQPGQPVPDVPEVVAEHWNYYSGDEKLADGRILKKLLDIEGVAVPRWCRRLEFKAWVGEEGGVVCRFGPGRVGRVRGLRAGRVKNEVRIEEDVDVEDEEEEEKEDDGVPCRSSIFSRASSALSVRDEEEDAALGELGYDGDGLLKEVEEQMIEYLGHPAFAQSEEIYEVEEAVAHVEYHGHPALARTEDSNEGGVLVSGDYHGHPAFVHSEGIDGEEGIVGVQVHAHPAFTRSELNGIVEEEAEFLDDPVFAQSEVNGIVEESVDAGDDLS